MTIETFRAICMNRGITLDEGYALYMMYRTGDVGLPRGIPEESILKIKSKNLYSNGFVCESLKEEFRIAEMEFGDGSKYTQTLQMNDKAIRITQPVRRKELSIIPILDTLVQGMFKILVTDQVKNTELHKSIYSRALLYFNNDYELADYYLTWHYLWPTTGNKNQSWENLFMVPYSNVNLRSNTEHKLRDFKYTASRKDARIYILSTYLFIKSGIKEDGKTFIRKYENFKTERDEWFLYTIDLIDEMKENLPEIFHRNFMVSSKSSKFVNASSGILV